MSEQSISQTYKKTIADIEEKRLLNALDSLKKLAGAAAEWGLQSESETLADSYTSLLSYMGQGIADKDRDAFYCQFLRKAYILAVRSYRIAKSKERHTIYYTTLNDLEKQGISIANTFEKIGQLDRQLSLIKTAEQKKDEKQCTEEKEKLIETLFYLIWTSGFLSADETSLLRKAFHGDSIGLSNNNCLLIISALTLSLLHFLDPAKLQLLVEFYIAGNSHIRSRALVGITFGIMLNSKRLHLFPDIQNALKKLSATPSIDRQLSVLQVQLLSFSMTKESIKDVEDILKPVITKGSTIRNNGFNISRIEEMFDNDQEFMMPEEKEFTDHLQKNVERLMQMYQQGIDVYYTSFRNMKRFPFFNTVANWFQPFDSDNRNVAKSDQEPARSMLTLISEAGLCDSDKYSAMLMLQSMPIANGAFPTNEISSFLGTSPTGNKHGNRPLCEEALRNSYLQDCYRFFTLYYRCNELYSPFKEDIAIIHIPYLRGIIQKNTDNIAYIANIAYKQNNFALAAETFGLIQDEKELAPENLQIYGSSLLKTGNAEKAATIFLLADTLMPNSLAIMQNLATSYRATGNIKAASGIYRKMLKMAPENKSLLYRYGETLFLNGQKAEALKIFYKLEYLAPESLSAKRAIAWCSLSSDRPDSAEHYYSKILDQNPKAEDYLNSGHAAWCNGNLPLAAQRYKKYVQTACKGNARLFDLPPTDIELLRHYNVSENDIQLMKDLLISGQ